MDNKSYVISPYQFGDADYTIVSFTYHTDGIVSNDRGKIVQNADELLGDDFASHFGEYEDDPDTVYVRNDQQRVDYEIIRDFGPYQKN